MLCRLFSNYGEAAIKFHKFKKTSCKSFFFFQGLYFTKKLYMKNTKLLKLDYHFKKLYQNGLD